jgi:hypothetical protein
MPWASVMQILVTFVSEHLMEEIRRRIVLVERGKPK